MEGTLVLQEKRSVVNKFRDWYKQKVVDSGLSQKFEKIIDTRCKVLKKKNDILEKVLPSIVAKIPEVEFLAPLIPAISRIGKFTYELEEKIIISAKRFFENIFVGTEGKGEGIDLPEANTDGLDDDVDTIATGIQGQFGGNKTKDSESGKKDNASIENTEELNEPVYTDSETSIGIKR